MNQDLNLDALLESLEKEASVAVSSTENEQSSDLSSELESLLEKEAESESTGDESDMTKQAKEQGEALAKQIVGTLKKQAADIAAKSQELAAEQDAQTLPTPQGTIDQVLKALIDRAVAEGGNDDDGMLDSATQGKDPTNHGTMPANGGPADPANDKTAPTSDNTQIALAQETEKAAAVSELVSHGMDFQEAFDLVKAAAEEIAQEEAQGDNIEMAKSAAISELVQNGVSFDEAFVLVKEALEQAEKGESVSEMDKAAAYNALVEGGLDAETAQKAISILAQ